MNVLVYILYSSKLDKFYVGFSENFTQRKGIHNSDENEKWTKVGRPWIEYLLIECNSKPQALKIEKYIKKQKSKKYIIALKQNPRYVQNLLERFTQY